MASSIRSQPRVEHHSLAVAASSRMSYPSRSASSLASRLHDSIANSVDAMSAILWLIASW